MGLSAYVDFYVSNFGMTAPENLISIYLAQDAGEMLELARQLHGIEVSQSSIGYSFRNDQSMVAIVPERAYGTLAHELFHLMVRRDFGDVPAWMDEGYAALYEVSRVYRDRTVVGLPNWRGEVIRKLGGPEFPMLQDLTRADWDEFNAEGFEAGYQAMNHAKARYFALYLQEKGKLAETYRRFRERNALDVRRNPGDDSVGLIETILGKSIDEIDRDYIAWFRRMRD
jgi:hypothetical protein